jgi:DME family drug/metabolite transporter|tara:strand:+ start:607 stop:1473 length:867 start_codon:yes stop_codon:yes gene_type:complete
MQFIYKAPGYLLILIGAFFLSWGGLLVREFDGANIWQILFWRAFFFTITLIIFIYCTYKKEAFSIIKKSGLPGVLGGVAMSLGFIAYIVSMTQTTVANVLFIISTQTIWLAIFGYLFLKEKISIKTLFSIILAMIGIAVMIGGSLDTSSLFGSLVALFIPINFAFLILLIRKFDKLDLVPALFYGGIIIIVVGFFMSETIIITPHDLLTSFILGTFQHAFGFICIVIGARSTPSVTVGLLMLSETLLGPFWVWVFLNEIPPMSVFIGGSIIVAAVIFKTLEQKRSYVP